MVYQQQQQSSSSLKPSSSLTTKKTSTRKKRIPPYAKLPGSLGGSSGYAGDMESPQNAGVLPTSIQLTSRQKKRYAIVDVKPLYPDGKRPKPSKEELNYLASNALEEMKKAKMKPKTRRPRVFPNQSKVDMSQVKMIPSRVYDAGGNNLREIPGEKQDSSWFQLFQQVAKEVAHVYQHEQQHNDLRLKDFHEGVGKAKAMDTHAEHPRVAVSSRSSSESSSSSEAGTSSFTESDGDECERTCTRFSPLPVDAVGSSSSTTEAIRTGDGSNNKQGGKGLLTLEKSLCFSSRPKIVALSTSPYHVIHANAAFLRSAANINVVGKPVCQVFGTTGNDGVAHALMSVSESKQQTVLTGQQYVWSNDSESSMQPLDLSISPVGSPIDEIATHVCIEVVSHENEVKNPSGADSGESMSVVVLG